jgi:hypothetical protein
VKLKVAPAISLLERPSFRRVIGSPMLLQTAPREQDRTMRVRRNDAGRKFLRRDNPEKTSSPMQGRMAKTGTTNPSPRILDRRTGASLLTDYGKRSFFQPKLNIMDELYCS